VDIDVNRNTNFNRNIDRGKYATQYQGGRGNWQHNPEHRKGVAYRDQATGQRYNRASTNDAVRSRENYRGRGEAGRQEIGRGGGDPSGGRADPGRRGDSAARPATRETGGRDLSGQRGDAFAGMDRGGSATRDFSSRGSQSRQNMSAGGRGGGGRGGGRR
jgi:hypothetical protein